MESNLIFNFNGNDIRSIINTETGDPWFIAKDVCDVLGFSETAAATRHLDCDEVSTCPVDWTGQVRNISIINESGLYSLILRSRKPEAKAFKKWVTSEVLPAIRKHGGYLTRKKMMEALLHPDTLIKLAENKDPWFIAKDVCDVLGFKNPSDATKYLDLDEATLINNPSGRGGSKTTIINESGLYSPILRSLELGHTPRRAKNPPEPLSGKGSEGFQR